MDIQLLPTHTTKRSVWREYIKASRSLYIHTAGYHSFCKIWKKFLSHILITKPKSDLCWVCQRNNRTINSTTNLSESVKQQVNLNIFILQFYLPLIGTPTSHSSFRKSSNGEITLQVTMY